MALKRAAFDACRPGAFAFRRAAACADATIASAGFAAGGTAGWAVGACAAFGAGASAVGITATLGEFVGAFARTAAACAVAHIASPVFSASWVHIVKGFTNRRKGLSDSGSMSISLWRGSGLGSKGYARAFACPRVGGRTDPGARMPETAK